MLQCNYAFNGEQREGCGGERVIALKDIRGSVVFIFIRFYELEKHCHAYQFMLEQMDHCGCMFCYTHVKGFHGPRGNNFETEISVLAWSLSGDHSYSCSVSFPFFSFPFLLHPFSSQPFIPGQDLESKIKPGSVCSTLSQRREPYADICRWRGEMERACFIMHLSL